MSILHSKMNFWDKNDLKQRAHENIHKKIVLQLGLPNNNLPRETDIQIMGPFINMDELQSQRPPKKRQRRNRWS